MVTKAIKKTEVDLGFINIPLKDRKELIGDTPTPFCTKLNDAPAKVDKQGRLWSEYLKNRYPVNTKVTISRNNGVFQISTYEQRQDTAASEVVAQQETQLPKANPPREKVWYEVLEGDCIKYLNEGAICDVSTTFFDPPYNQGKEYRFFDDKQPEGKYWSWTEEILRKTYEATQGGGALYFMQREKNAERVLRTLRKTGWNFQNLIIWKKKTSAVPCSKCFSKQYQIIAYAIKGFKPRVFNKLRIDPPPLPEHKYEHENGVFLTDVWDDIRELTSGYFAGDEAFRYARGKRAHTQQSPVALLLRIILSSTMPRDIVFDPCAGLGTALVVAKQLQRNSIGVEIDPSHVELIRKRLRLLRAADSISRYYEYYRFSPNLENIWQHEQRKGKQRKLL
jgi:site-specific DNA-methyltransferase (adenine-specific)